MKMLLDDKVALITGGSRGIGKAIAMGLAAEGCRVVISARNKEQLDATATAIRAVTGSEVVPIVADVMDPATPALLVERCKATFGKLDILIANAGGTLGGRDFVEATNDDWARTFQLNVLHSTDLLRAAIPILAASQAPSVVFVASISGRAPTARGASYAAAKAALIHAARSLAWELAPAGIRVNALSPGSTMFPGGGWDRTRQQFPDAFGSFEQTEFPRHRLSTLDEIADAAVFLASPRSMGINATDLQVDGGQRKPAMR